MGIYQLTNVPTDASKLEIRPIVDGETIKIVCSVKNAEPDDYSMMTSTLVGDHMLSKPQALREMYARDLVSAISMARDAGYAQAKAEIRAVLGIPRS